MSVSHGLVYAVVVLSFVFSFISRGASVVQCDERTSCVNGKCAPKLSNQTQIVHHCQCDALWFGANCSEFICDREDENPCRNGGDCQPLDNHKDYQCLCDGNHSGKHCEISHLNCTNASCNEHGNCSDSALLPSGYRCDCEAGFNGDDCENNINECEGVNCNNGTCVDGINDYICECRVNYTGRHCDHPDYCAIHSAERSYGCGDGVCCANGGTCYNDLVNGRHACNCIPPWLSFYGCKRAAQPCAWNPCQNNGICEAHGVDYVCHCGPNYTGESCENHIVPCTNNTCHHNGTCTVELTEEGQETGQHCQCPPYYTGDLCEIHFDPCTNKCQNNGTCHSNYTSDGDYNTVCSCTKYFTGENCTSDIDECSTSNPCQNNATCINLHGSFNCVCQDGFMGERCETNIDDCVDVMCKNNGSCADLVNDFECNCIPEYSGKLCQWHYNQTCNGSQLACYEAHTINCTDDYEGTVATADGNGFECSCKEGFIGERCEAKVLQCQDNMVCGGPQRKLECIEGEHMNDYQCVCRFGYAGDRCEIDIDLCENSPCQNNGTCIDLHESFNCICQDGFTGERCEINIDDCVNVTCENNGTCVDLVNDFECNCIPEYSGKHCQWYRNRPCDGVNCNNGTCVDGINDYTCECHVNYTGRHCDHPDYCAIHSAERTYGCGDGVCCANGGTCYNDLVNGRHECNCIPPWLSAYSCRRAAQPCAWIPCQNNGTCEPRGLDYVCHCGPNFSGKDCSLLKCTNNTCYNGGTCVAKVTYYGQQQCHCLPYYTGDLCETHFDPCTNKCQNNGTCQSNYTSDGDYNTVCSCTEYFTGENCTSDIDECSTSNPCQNNATCINLHGSFNCVCQDGFMGERCETNIDDCVDVMCKNNGSCVDLVNDFECNCIPEYSGKLCQWHYNQTCNGSQLACYEAHTINCTDDYEGTVATADGNGFECSCKEGFIGERCEAKVLQCQDNMVCGGPQRKLECIEGEHMNDYQCVCRFGYAGDRCEIDIDLCENSPCQNNGTCIDLHESFNCICQDGFTGERCEINIDDCVNVTCENNGTCVDLVNDFECNCIPEYSGKHCQWYRNRPCDGVNCNNGTCVDGINDYTCECHVNYTGRHCDHPDYCAIHSAERSYGCIDGVCCANGGTCYNDLVNGRHECNCIPPWLARYGCRRAARPCAWNPCQNNGTCEPRGLDYVCHCGPNFGGKDCSLQLIECTNNTCYNGGTCVAKVTYYGQQQCHCLPYYIGDLCETHDPCTNKCQNNGTCQSNYISDGEYNTVCSCTEYFTGENCTNDIDECSTSNPCQNNATCINLHGSFNCVCQDGFTGERCETNIDDCVNVMCMNNGSCVDLVNDFECNCIPEYLGKHCQWYRNRPCEGVNCNNGICVDGINDYTCECFVNYTGRHCDHPDYCAIHSAERTYGCADGICCANGGTCYNNLENGRHECNCIPPWLNIYSCRRRAQPCAWSPCQNNGSCEAYGFDYVCHCGPTFTGRRCETRFCPRKTCHNNGTCIPELTSDGQYIEYCQCTPYYTGDLCEVKLKYCGNASVCGGPERKLSCTEDNSSYYCECKFGYAGDRCDIDLDLCENSPCQNGGTCDDHGNNFTCQCQYGYTGRTCDTLLPVTVHPRNATIPMGSNVTITCKANILGTVLYTWERRNDQKWIVVDIYNSTTLTTSFFGRYKCKVFNVSISEAAIVKVQLQDIFEITEQPKSGVLKSGRPHILKCKATGPGTLIYSWEIKTARKWATVIRYTRFYTTLSPGQYRCRVTNEAGSIVSKIATVKFCSPPRILIPPVSQLVAFNTSVTVRCEGSGIKPLVHRWATRSNNTHSWTILDHSSTKLVLKGVQSTQQARCLVYNECGVTLSSPPATITVFKITTHPQSKQVLIGSKVSLTCVSSVSFSVNFLWTNNGRKVQFDNDHAVLISTGGSSTLFIDEVKSRDAGDYVCEARCGPLSVTSTVATLTVTS